MTRRLVLGPDQIRAVRRDPRFVAARRAEQSRPDPGWRARGRCLVLDPGTFFPDAPEEADTAVAACRGCPVAGPCLASALATAEPEGVWGGTTPAERRAMRVVWTGRC